MVNQILEIVDNEGYTNNKGSLLVVNPSDQSNTSYRISDLNESDSFLEVEYRYSIKSDRGRERINSDTSTCPKESFLKDSIECEYSIEEPSFSKNLEPFIQDIPHLFNTVWGINTSGQYI